METSASFEARSAPSSYSTTRVLKELTVPEILLRTTLVTVPVMKTHNKTVITGAIKNQWGCLPMFRHNYHLVLDAALADINAVVRPCFAMMDATVGLEGNSPKSGKPKVVNRMLASGDCVALGCGRGEDHGLRSGAHQAPVGVCRGRPRDVPTCSRITSP